MPQALNITDAVSSLKWAEKHTKSVCEVHYALIKGENDFVSNMLKLNELFSNTNINVKFIRLNEKGSSHLEGVEYEEMLGSILHLQGVKYEFYSPPGKDVGASCGQFLLDYYERYKNE